MEAEKKLNVLALISGGKDSIFNILKCQQAGHTIVALANLYPSEMGKEIDSYMYQSVGGHLIENIAEALDKPLYRKYLHFFVIFFEKKVQNWVFLKKNKRKACGFGLGI